MKFSKFRKISKHVQIFMSSRKFRDNTKFASSILKIDMCCEIYNFTISKKHVFCDSRFQLSKFKNYKFHNFNFSNSGNHSFLFFETLSLLDIVSLSLIMVMMSSKSVQSLTRFVHSPQRKLGCLHFDIRVSTHVQS